MISSTWDGNINWLFHVRDSHSWVKALNHSDTSPISEFSPSLASPAQPSPAQHSSARAKNGFDIPLMLCVVWYQIPSPHTPPRPLTCPDCWEMSRWIFLRGRQLIYDMWYHTTHYTIQASQTFQIIRMDSWSCISLSGFEAQTYVVSWVSQFCVETIVVFRPKYLKFLTKIFDGSVSGDHQYWARDTSWMPSYKQ